MAFLNKRNLVLFLVGLAVTLGSFALGYSLGQDSVVCKVCKPEEIDFSLFWETYKKLQEKFIFPEKIDAQKVIYGAISGMVKSLEDPYTVFLNPGETKTFLEDVAGTFEGIGAEIGKRKGELQIIAPLEGTPAQKAGLRPGDKILKIDEKFTTDMSVDEAVNLIRGQKETEVTLTIFREAWKTPKEIKIVRDVIAVPSLKWEMKEQDIAYLKLYLFSQKAGSDFSKAAQGILNSPAQKIILDLRNNPGGYLEVAQEIAGWFLEKGQVVVIEELSDGKRKEYESKGPSQLLSLPVVVLLNQGSASGAEILAGALRDNRGIKIIGEKSFGKGSVQEMANLSDGSSLKVTIANWLTPKGETISEKGLTPDIEIEMTDEDYEQGLDPQLDKAIEIIKGMR